MRNLGAELEHDDNALNTNYKLSTFLPSFANLRLEGSKANYSSSLDQGETQKRTQTIKDMTFPNRLSYPLPKPRLRIPSVLREEIHVYLSSKKMK